MQVRLLPGARPLVAGIPALLGAELGTVHDPPSCPVDLGRMDLVEHLVEYDHLHEVAGDPPVIEGGMDADELLVMEVHAHLDRAAPAGRAPPAPPDPGAHGAIEVARVQVGVDVAQIVRAVADAGPACVLGSRVGGTYASMARPWARRLRPVKPASARITGSCALAN